ncbi:RNA recognition motif 2, partial [Pyronema omphalodes]
LDTRTTVMLRNIPNKVDQETLKSYIDETSRGLYNFLYLRIDFRNICNVGYAFINFLDVISNVLQFVKAKSGTRWNKFNSEKVLDVTYANIQGIDQLVEKFRNSSVMDQDPAYR